MIDRRFILFECAVLTINVNTLGGILERGTNFSPWFNPPTKYGMPSVHTNMFLNNLICHWIKRKCNNIINKQRYNYDIIMLSW